MTEVDTPTLVRCPLCEHCVECEGSHRVRCHVCPSIHDVDCPYCEACGLCDGTHLVTAEDRAAWLLKNAKGS